MEVLPCYDMGNLQQPYLAMEQLIIITTLDVMAYHALFAPMSSSSSLSSILAQNTAWEMSSMDGKCGQDCCISSGAWFEMMRCCCEEKM